MKPDDVRPQQLSTRIAAGQIGQRLKAANLAAAAARAAHMCEIAVKFHDVFASRTAMQTIHVLCDKREMIVAIAALEINQSSVSRVRLDRGQALSTHIVESADTSVGSRAKAMGVATSSIW